MKAGQTIQLWNGDEDRGTAKIAAGAHVQGPGARVRWRRPCAGDIVAVTGIEDVNIGFTICELDKPDGVAADLAWTSRRSP